MGTFHALFLERSEEADNLGGLAQTWRGYQKLANGQLLN
jgi:hypothetical protein